MSIVRLAWNCFLSRYSNYVVGGYMKGWIWLCTALQIVYYLYSFMSICRVWVVGASGKGLHCHLCSSSDWISLKLVKLIIACSSDYLFGIFHSFTFIQHHFLLWPLYLSCILFYSRKYESFLLESIFCGGVQVVLECIM